MALELQAEGLVARGVGGAEAVQREAGEGVALGLVPEEGRLRAVLHLQDAGVDAGGVELVLEVWKRRKRHEVTPLSGWW